MEASVGSPIRGLYMADGPIAFLPLLVLGVVGITLVFVTLLANRFFAPKRGSVGKLTNYECGELATPGARGPIDVQYYMYILTFLIFDVEVMFLIPFALQFKTIGMDVIVATIFFVALILVGYFYELRKKLLTWRTLA